jgi:hypothetical protein
MRNIFALIVVSFFVTFSSHAGMKCKAALQKSYMLNIYEITLCKQENASYEKLFETTFSIKLNYKMPSSGRWIDGRSFAEIKKHYALTKEEEVMYKKFFTGLFPSIKSGDEILFEFEPQTGGKLYLNGKFFAQITDKTLAERFANIWLHPNSTFKQTRNLLLTNE